MAVEGDGKKKKAYKLKTVLDEKRIVQLIIDKYLELKSLTKLESYLLQNDIKTKNNKSFSRFTLKIILTNPVYAKNDVDIYDYFTNNNVDVFADKEEFDGQKGVMAYNKTTNVNTKLRKKVEQAEWIIAIGKHEGFIEGSKWIKVQDLLKQNEKRRYRMPRKNNSLLAGIMRCGKCGSFMRPKISSRRKTVGAGLVPANEDKFWYLCELKEKTKGSKCDGNNIYGKEADRIVLQTIKELCCPVDEKWNVGAGVLDSPGRRGRQPLRNTIYKELKKIASTNKTDGNKQEIMSLKYTYNKNEKEIENLIQRIKYIDIELIDDVNKEIKKLKQSNINLEEEIKKIENNPNGREIEQKEIANLMLNIIKNYFTSFETFDLIEKRELLKLLIESVVSDGDEITINLLNSKTQILLPPCDYSNSCAYVHKVTFEK